MSDEDVLAGDGEGGQGQFGGGAAGKGGVNHW